MNVGGATPVSLRTLLHAATTAQAEVDARLGAVGLSLPKLLALQALAAAGGTLPLSQLAERLSCVKSNITQLVDRLEGDGLVAREADPGDRRARLAALTPAGRHACAEGTRLHQEAEASVLRALSSDEAQQLAALLRKIDP